MVQKVQRPREWEDKHFIFYCNIIKSFQSYTLIRGGKRSYLNTFYDIINLEVLCVFNFA